MTTEKAKPNSFWLDFTYGTITSVISKLAQTPVEKIKIVCQVQQDEAPSDVQILQDSWQSRGIWGVFNGASIHLPRYVVTQSMNVALKSRISRLFPNYHPKREYLKNFLVNVCKGALAGAISLLFVYPLDTIQTRLIADTTNKYNGVWDCAVKSYEEVGLLGLYNGYEVSLIGIILYRASFFAFYDAFKPDHFKPAPINRFLLSQCTVTLAGLASYPYDTARRMAMVTGKPTSECWDTIVANHGISGLFAGAFWNTVRGTLGSLVLLALDSLFPSFSSVE